MSKQENSSARDLPVERTYGVLLRPNRRALLIGCLPPAILAALCLAALVGSSGSHRTELVRTGLLVWIVAGPLLVLSLSSIAGLCLMAYFPRVALTADHLLVYLRGYQPYRVPLDIVEGFFQGRGSATAQEADTTKSTQVIVRLAERAPQWHDRPVKRSLGAWEGGYITIRGTWCEPITETKLRQLNAQLASAKRIKTFASASE